MNGVIISDNGEKGVKIPIIMIAIKIFGPYIWSFQANSGWFLEMILPKICDPSKGAIGIILNTASAMLIVMKKYKAWSKL